LTRRLSSPEIADGWENAGGSACCQTLRDGEFLNSGRTADREWINCYGGACV
jgi:hypothetical protein